jgi:hypothetical protein
MPQRRLLAFYLLTLLGSLLAALLVVEIVLRNLAFTNGTAFMFGAQQRWYERHWTPVNEMQFRDLPLQGRLALKQPKVYFLGDSFTAGNGVSFEETYYFLAAWKTRQDYNPVNLSRPGASTRDELDTLKQFNAATGARAKIVVHQYFPNDIHDYIAMPQWTAPPLLEAAARHLESAQFLLAHRFAKEWGAQYADALRAAYTSPAVLQRHLDDVSALHAEVRRQGGRVVFLVFPSLSPDSGLDESARLIAHLRRFFTATCREGDVFVDALYSARTLPLERRVLSFMDSHPSPELHTLVASQVRQGIAQYPSGVGSARPYETCAYLRTLRTAP